MAEESPENRVVQKSVVYTVENESFVSLSVVVGNAQYGLVDVRFYGDGRPLAREPRVQSLPIGQGAALLTKRLVVRTIVNDVNPHSNKAIVTHVLSGGVDNEVHSLEGTVEEQGDFLPCKLEVTFELGG